MLTIKSHGVEISNARGPEGLFVTQIPCLFLSFLFFTFFFLFILDLFRLLGTKSACSASYGIKKPFITNQTAPGKKPSTQVPKV